MYFTILKALSACLLISTSFAATMTLPGTTVHLNSMSDAKLSDVQVFAHVECFYQLPFHPGQYSCVSHEMVELQRAGADDIYVMPDLIFDYVSRFKRNIVVGLTLKVKGAVISFGPESEFLRAEVSTYKKVFSEVTLFSLNPVELRTHVDGLELPLWLEKNFIDELKYSLFVSPLDTRSSAHYEKALRNNREVLSSETVIGFSGKPKPDSKMGINLAVSYGEINGPYLLLKQVSVPLSRDLPEDLFKLDLNSDHLNRSLTGSWDGYLSFSEEALRLPEGTTVEYYSFLSTLTCNEQGVASGKLSSYYGLNGKLTTFEIPVAGTCDKFPLEIEMKNFPLLVCKGVCRLATEHSIENRDIVLRILNIGDEHMFAKLLDGSSRAPIGELRFTNRVKN